MIQCYCGFLWILGHWICYLFAATKQRQSWWSVLSEDVTTWQRCKLNPDHAIRIIVTEVESSRTSLASRTHFEVLGLEGQVLGLEASSPRKLACPRLEDSSIFWIVKISWSAWKIFWKTCFCGDRWKNFCEDLFFFFFFFFFFWRALALVSLVLGLEHSCPWPRECLSSERLSLALDFFCVLGLGLEPCVLDSTSAS